MRLDKFTEPFASIWGNAFNRSLDSGDDHGYAAYAADCAVDRARTKARKQARTLRPRAVRKEG